MTRGALATAALALLTLLALAGQTALVARAGFLMGDFHAFYCAGRVTLQRADPYRVEPLRSCERSTGLNRFIAKNAATVPAPLPGYAIAAFVPLGLLPVNVAGALWLLLLIAACAVTVVTVTRFAGVPWPVPLGALVLSLGAASLPFGEIVPIAVAAISASALFAWRQRWRAAAACAAVAMLEPHLGLPACAALALWAPRTRITLLAAAVVFAALSIAAIGVPANIEYFASVLPAHALSEAARDTQFSLTSVLASLGTDPVAAVGLGSLSYVAMVVLGVLIAARLSRESGNAAFLVCVPPAFAVFCGTFVHVTQIAVALPAAMLLVTFQFPQRRTPAVLAIMLLSVPWVMAWSPALGLAPAFPIAYLAWRYWGGTLLVILISALVAAGLLVGLNQVLATAAIHPGPSPSIPRIDPDLAQASWAAFTSKSSTGALGAWLVRLPTWAGLMLLLGTVASAANVFGMKALRRSVAS